MYPISSITTIWLIGTNILVMVFTTFRKIFLSDSWLNQCPKNANWCIQEIQVSVQPTYGNQPLRFFKYLLSSPGSSTLEYQTENILSIEEFSVKNRIIMSVSAELTIFVS